MVDKYKFVQDKLKSVTSNAYPESAYSKASFPYVVFSFPTVSELEKNTDGIILEIDIWDTSKPNYDVFTAIETLTSEIEKVFKDCRSLNGDNFLLFQRINRLSIPDENSNIKRRQLRFLIKSYE